MQTIINLLSDPWVRFAMAFWLLYFVVAMYGETQRKTSHFWRGYTDVTGLRIFGLNKD